VGKNGSASFASSAVNGGAVGNGGDININADSLSVTNGARLTTITLEPGNGGNINVNADNLTVLGGGEVLTTSFGSGNAGNIKINVTENITLAGSDRNYVGQTAVFGSGAASGLFTNTYEKATGQGGTLEITAGRLIVTDGAQVNVSNQGTGNAGNLKITADLINLSNSGSLSAETRAGSGGNIIINAGDIQMRRGSNITTNATGTATGGNINIDTDTLVALENSDITANAQDNFGGRVIINAQAIFGTEYRPQLTPESDITASSSLGASFNGVVQINSPDVDTTSALVELPQALTDPSNQIATGCAASKGNNFAVTGRGGLPENPTATIRGVTLWSDLRPMQQKDSAMGRLGNSEVEKVTAMTSPLIEATGWVTDEIGRVKLVAQAPESTAYQLWQKTTQCGNS
jgi:large exoprotein involved in heme utilization and adhesion